MNIFCRPNLKVLFIGLCISTLAHLQVEAKGIRLRLGGVIAHALSAGKNELNVLSREQLRVCLTNEAEFKKSESLSLVGTLMLETEKKNLEKLQLELTLKNVDLDRANQIEIDEYNLKVDEFNKTRKRYNNSVDQHNLGVNEKKLAIDSFNLKCANKRYYQDDFDAINLASDSGSTSQ